MIINHILLIEVWFSNTKNWSYYILLFQFYLLPLFMPQSINIIIIRLYFYLFIGNIVYYQGVLLLFCIIIIKCIVWGCV